MRLAHAHRLAAQSTSRPPPPMEPPWLRWLVYSVIFVALLLFAAGQEAPALGLFGLAGIVWSITGLRYLSHLWRTR